EGRARAEALPAPHRVAGHDETPQTVNNDFQPTPGPPRGFRGEKTPRPRPPFEIPAMKNPLVRAYRLADKAPVELKTDNGKMTFLLERPMLDPMATVVVVEFQGQKVER